MYKYKKIKLKNGKTRDEHRIIMENYTGRTLEFNEIVHHKDGNKRNNNIENLKILDRSTHMRLHRKNGDIVAPKISESTKIKMCSKQSKVCEDVAKRIKYCKDRAIDLCKELNISKYVIHRIRSGKSWKHI